MALSVVPMALYLLGFLIAFLTHGPDALLFGPGVFFQLFVMALPGLLGLGLWNMQNSARISSLIVLAIGAASGLVLVAHFGLLSFMTLVYVVYLVGGAAIAFYLTRPSVKKAFQPEIDIINFKDL